MTENKNKTDLEQNKGVRNNTHGYIHITLDNIVKTTHWRTASLINGAGGNRVSIFKRMKLDPLFSLCTKISQFEGDQRL